VSQVIVEGVIKRTGETDGALRTVALTDMALDILTAMPRPLDSRELVFTAPKGGLVSLRNFRSRTWYPALVAAGAEKRVPYQCRHTFATLALAAGADLYWVSRQLGHTDIGTTLSTTLGSSQTFRSATWGCSTPTSRPDVCQNWVKAVRPVSRRGY
jgi:integrase